MLLGKSSKYAVPGSFVLSRSLLMYHHLEQWVQLQIPHPSWPWCGPGSTPSGQTRTLASRTPYLLHHAQLLLVIESWQLQWQDIELFISHDMISTASFCIINQHIYIYIYICVCLYIYICKTSSWCNMIFYNVQVSLIIPGLDFWDELWTNVVPTVGTHDVSTGWPHWVALGFYFKWGSWQSWKENARCSQCSARDVLHWCCLCKRFCLR